MTFEIHAEISGNNARLETRLVGDYSQLDIETLDKLLDYAIIKTDNNEIRKKDNWVKGDKGLFAGSVPVNGGRMTVKEITRVSHQIATDYPLLTASERRLPYENRNNFYIFNVLGFGSYKFHFKLKIDGNEDLIREIRKELRNSND